MATARQEDATVRALKRVRMSRLRSTALLSR